MVLKNCVNLSLCLKALWKYSFVFSTKCAVELTTFTYTQLQLEMLWIHVSEKKKNIVVFHNINVIFIHKKSNYSYNPKCGSAVNDSERVDKTKNKKQQKTNQTMQWLLRNMA